MFKGIILLIFVTFIAILIKKCYKCGIMKVDKDVIRKGECEMKSKYDALELSKKVISLAEENGLYISNLQLQKVMYYIQGNFMKEFNKKAFLDNIECWEYGPVIKKIWSTFNVYGSSPIRGINSQLNITEDEKCLIISILKDKLSMNVWRLVDETHDELPWKNANHSGSSILSDADMVEYFCK